MERRNPVHRLERIRIASSSRGSQEQRPRHALRFELGECFVDKPRAESAL